MFTTEANEKEQDMFPVKTYQLEEVCEEKESYPPSYRSS
jgi:hypothetical protein